MKKKTISRNLLRVEWTRLKMLVHAHLLNPLWYSEDHRRERRCQAMGRILTDYMKKYYLKAADSVVPRPVEHQDSQEKIYTLWLQGENQAPPIVKACFKNIRKHCTQELVILDADSIRNYVTLPEALWEKYRAGKITHAHFADICRVELLYEHGGYWMDSTCYATGPIPRHIQEQDFFVFMAGKRIHGNYSYIQNCFIRARKSAYLLEAWRAMILDYWLHEEKRVDYFMHQVMFRTLVHENPTAAQYFAAFPHIDQYPTHLYLYEYKDKPWDPEVFRKATDDGFFYQKTTYRELEKIVPGSFAHHLVEEGLTAQTGTAREFGQQA